MSAEPHVDAPLPDLQECAREPIHIPGRIQPHGVLLGVSEPELAIRLASSNAESLLHRSPEQLLKQDLHDLLPPEAAQRLVTHLERSSAENLSPLTLTWSIDGSPRTFDLMLHRRDGLLLVELEPVGPGEEAGFADFYHRIRDSLSRLQEARTIRELCQAAAEEVRAITGFDRVMVYQFDPEWNGEVIAEDRRDDLEPFLGLHYPASDIPAQARALYTLNWIRLIVDVGYRPVDLLPAGNPLTGGPLDMSCCILRSVSPVHIEYLHNMGVGASMSVSLLREGRLWGLIACHHVTPRHVPYAIRSACELIGQTLSLQFSLRQRQEDLDFRVRLGETIARLRERVAGEPALPGALAAGQAELLELAEAGGAALVQEGQATLYGRTPPEAAVQRLDAWLQQYGAVEPFATESLGTLWPEGEAHTATASGLLSIALSRTNRLLWFRPEVVRVVNWSGDPRKPVETAQGQPRIHPRKSFELWKETVRGRSRPWHPAELEAAQDLRGALVDLLLRRSETEARLHLERLNAELLRSNEELDAFAYIASHDLREPLRGIRNSALFVLEDFPDDLQPEIRGRLETITRLCDRMAELMDALLEYSRVGRLEMAVGETDLNEVVNDVLELLGPRLAQEAVEVRIPRPLPTLCCDRIRIGEVYNNLITNAIKYNDKDRKWLEIGYREPSPTGTGEDSSAQTVFYVRDNGIGIRPADQSAIFSMFRRLHARDQFGGGTGAGLTIASRIITRHGGQIWVESEPGAGTSFCFTLSPLRSESEIGALTYDGDERSTRNGPAESDSSVETSHR